MLREITGFAKDDAGEWIARLACGHTQHVRHKPPMQDRAWVTTDKGRAAMIGKPLQCLYCDMPALPEGLEVYKTSREFTESTIPDGMLRDHRTRAGTWGRIVVTEGKLLYALADSGGTGWVLRPGIVGIIAPGVQHWVAPHGPVRFTVEFLHAPDDD